MAKASGTRKQSHVSKHSRAARRETSPSIDTDKSLKNVPPPDEAKTLSVHHGAGITKRKTKGKRLSRTQRLRQEKGMARAEAVIDQMETKVAQSTKKAKVIKGRRTDWEDINKAAGDRSRARKKFDVQAEDDDWENVKNIDMGDDNVSKDAGATEAQAEKSRGSPSKEKDDDEVQVW